MEAKSSTPDIPDLKPPVVALVRPAAPKLDHRADGEGACQVRDVEALDDLRAHRQVQRFLEGQVFARSPKKQISTFFLASMSNSFFSPAWGR